MAMTALEFARAYLHPFSVKGDEIIPALCPFCHGGQKHDKQTFALSMSSLAYNCKRGSCGKQGAFRDLCRTFGVSSDTEGYKQPVKTYKQPKKKPERLTEQAEKYLSLRGISRATMEAYRVGADADGNIQFPYFDSDGNHVFNKFRAPRKLCHGERKMWREAGTKPILFGMHKCDAKEPLTICEGEIDAMACHEAGIPNAVSIPSGAEDFSWVNTCWEFLQKYEVIYLFGDMDAPGAEMIQRLCVKLSDWHIYVVVHECKDANELLYRQGVEAVRAAWLNAPEAPVEGLINLASVVPLDIRNLPSVSTSIQPLDQITGGFYFGDLSVWTGKRGDGKSTLLSMLLLDAVQDGRSVCAYSGELRADRFQFWVDVQAAGKEHVRAYFDQAKNRQVRYVPQEIREKIHAWYNQKFWLYDNAISQTNEDATVLQLFETAAKRYDCRVFLVDNLMTADYGRSSDSDYYRAQSRFVGQLVAIANRHNVHVHLVAHPRKTQDRRLSNDDIAGSVDITNRAANVFTLGRTKESEFDTLLDVTKNRWEGSSGSIGLNYCQDCRRLYDPKVGNKTRYGWDTGETEIVDLDGQTYVPF